MEEKINWDVAVDFTFVFEFSLALITLHKKKKEKINVRLDKVKTKKGHHKNIQKEKLGQLYFPTLLLKLF
jgi:hypothetical protein